MGRSAVLHLGPSTTSRSPPCPHSSLLALLQRCPSSWHASPCPPAPPHSHPRFLQRAWGRAEPLHFGIILLSVPHGVLSHEPRASRSPTTCTIHPHPHPHPPHLPSHQPTSNLWQGLADSEERGGNDDLERSRRLRPPLHPLPAPTPTPRLHPDDLSPAPHSRLGIPRPVRRGAGHFIEYILLLLFT